MVKRRMIVYSLLAADSVTYWTSNFRSLPWKIHALSMLMATRRLWPLASSQNSVLVAVFAVEVVRLCYRDWSHSLVVMAEKIELMTVSMSQILRDQV